MLCDHLLAQQCATPYHPAMLTGLVLFIVLAVAGLLVEAWLIGHLRHDRLNDWLADHVYLPALRLPALIGFVLGAYPTLYGLSSAPALSHLIDFDWFGQALNLVFVLPLLFSLLPVAGHLPGILLPLQGAALTALLFGPLAAALSVEPHYFPGAPVLLIMLLLALAGHILGQQLVRRFPENLAAPLYDAAILACQAPAVLAYGRALGRQL